jgi:hypothetical protein
MEVNVQTEPEIKQLVSVVFLIGRTNTQENCPITKRLLYSPVVDGYPLGCGVSFPAARA